ncbi:GerMN domain-containing protein [Streptomyces sp. ISL-94]|uniref:GerMN domain-containing protein n=1 Tax=Streptomyces sp. ISL-94 TaxID=2819190 RepID=UPI001BE7B89E|nr:GerMN domain-containing protein [Streptomyces sp. ISL-94]MBT2481136.1 GerMN domain-containing protein [Streptomyces sp. ISL-94]
MTARKTRSRAAAATALAGCTLLLAGCGIKTTGVIDSGHAATVKVPGAGKSTVLYFLSKEGDRLVPAPFTLFDGYTIAPLALVHLLLDGPGGRAGEAGLTTALPRLPAGKEDSVTVSEYSPSEGMTVRVPFAVGDLSELARSQLVCTVGVSAVPDTLSRVTLQGTDTTIPSAECDLKR